MDVLTTLLTDLGGSDELFWWVGAIPCLMLLWLLPAIVERITQERITQKESTKTPPTTDEERLLTKREVAAVRRAVKYERLIDSTKVVLIGLVGVGLVLFVLWLPDPTTLPWLLIKPAVLVLFSYLVMGIADELERYYRLYSLPSKVGYGVATVSSVGAVLVLMKTLL